MLGCWDSACALWYNAIKKLILGKMKSKSYSVNWNKAGSEHIGQKYYLSKLGKLLIKDD